METGQQKDRSGNQGERSQADDNRFEPHTGTQQRFVNRENIPEPSLVGRCLVV